MLRDLALNLILFRFSIPVELRFIICETYFPFLPNESQPLTAKFIIDFLKQPLQFWEMEITPTIRNIIPDLLYDKSKEFACCILRCRDTTFLEISIVYGEIPTLQAYLIHHPRINNFYRKQIKIRNLQEETVDYITKWYRKKMLHAIDENMSKRLKNLFIETT